MVDRVETVVRQHGVEHPIRMTVATGDGGRQWAFRYSSERRSRSLFYITDGATLRELHSDNPALHVLSEETSLVLHDFVLWAA